MSMQSRRPVLLPMFNANPIQPFSIQIWEKVKRDRLFASLVSKLPIVVSHLSSLIAEGFSNEASLEAKNEKCKQV